MLYDLSNVTQALRKLQDDCVLLCQNWFLLVQPGLGICWLVFQVVPYADFVAHRSALVFQYSISESPFKLDHVVFEYAEQVHWVSCLGVLRDLSYSSSGTYGHICFCVILELIQTYFPTRTIWCRLDIFVLYRNSTDVTYIVMRWRLAVHSCASLVAVTVSQFSCVSLYYLWLCLQWYACSWLEMPFFEHLLLHLQGIFFCWVDIFCTSSILLFFLRGVSCNLEGPSCPFWSSSELFCLPFYSFWFCWPIYGCLCVNLALSPVGI